MASDRSRPAGGLVRDADQTMYAAKRRGTSWELFDPDSRVPVTASLGLEGELRYALERDELRLHYQPEIDVHPSGWSPSRPCCAGSIPTVGCWRPAISSPSPRRAG